MAGIRITLLVLLLSLAGCGGGDDGGTTLPRGRVETSGAELFNERVIGANPGCVTCHSLDETIVLVGPSLFGVESRVAGLSTEEYVRQSILEPDQYIVEGFDAGQMSPNWGDYLTSDQVESLVAFLTEKP